jgi:two-component system, NarL family, nitrate/nitrite response regulator NarL
MSNDLNPIRIVIADEHHVFRQDLRRSLESEAGLEILGEASDAHGALQLARQSKPDILLVDFALSQRFELKALYEAASHVPPVRVVVTVKAIEKSHLVEAFRLGAHGVVLKGSTARVLLKSIRSVMAGQYWLEGDSVGVLVEALRESLAHSNGTKSAKDYGLTRREVDIITKIASGRSNKEVGEEFAISERTVKHHLTNIFGKVGVSSRLQLALFAVNQHFMSSPGPSLSFQPVQPDDDV